MQSETPGGTCWYQWVLSGSVGSAGAVLLTGLFAGVLGLTDGATAALLGMLVGVGNGVGQWLVLRRRARWSRAWLLAGLAAAAASSVLCWKLGLDTITSGPIIGVVVGTALGAAQWPVLRREVRRGFLWPLMCGVAGTGAGFVAFVVVGLSGLSVSAALARAVSGVGSWGVGSTFGAVFGATFGALTGPLMRWMLGANSR